ncbi:YcaO-like family protein [Polaromonas sp.]|uniref:YcaO-like family protein n=1 Tax=Polaromonas sp. TaxID=1869339 RepID=UPI00326579DC
MSKLAPLSPSRRPVSLAVNSILNDAVPADVKASFLDPDRLSPMLAGACRLEGTLLVVRSATQDVEVQAPKAMLVQVFRLCDGTRTVREILKRLPAGFDAVEFGQFLDFLMEQGALIDSNLASAHAARYAFQGSPFGLSAESAVTNQICRRFLWNKEKARSALPPGTRKVAAVPLQEFFADRVSTYTFAEKEVSGLALLGLLWSVAGVVSVKHERVGYVTPKRTIASAGGMQLVQVFVVLQKTVERYKPGVYRVSYPDEHAVALEFLGEGHQLIPRAFSKPWELTYATGAIFLAADPQVAAMRYRNRSLQYLFMEAGAALHNAGLSAARLELGLATIGGYYESIVSSMCRLQGELVLGSAIFGAKPTPEQVGLIDRSPNLNFAWVDGDSARFAMPFHLARAKVITPDDSRPYTWGRDADPWIAFRKAAAEAVEREGFREPRKLSWARLDSLPHAIDPTQFVKYTDKQHADPEFPYERFNPAVPHLWTAGVDLRSGRAVQVLAELVFSRTSLAPHVKARGRRPISQVTSSGCAASTSLEDATYRALLEVVERDAFMAHWLKQAPGLVVSPTRLDASIRSRIQTLKDAGCKIVVQRLYSPWAHVCLVAAQHEALHFTTMGTAANPDFKAALSGALDETEARVYAWIHGHQPQINHPAEVVTTDHHFELYGLKRYFRRADRVLFPEGAPSEDRITPFRFKTADQLTARFAARNISPLMVDITPEHCFMDQGRTPLSVVKVLVPGLLPISFGYQREPLGMAPRFHPGSKFPHPFP